MDNSTAAIQSFIQEELVQLAQVFIRERVASLKARKIVASADLVNSFAYELNSQAKAEAVELLMAFEEHGRFIDMRRLKPPTEFGNPYINLLEEWIRKRGWEQKFIDGFMRRRKLRQVPKNVLNMIAWGIAIKRSNGKFRRKRWWNAPKTAFISDAFNQIAAALPDIVSQSMNANWDNIEGVRWDNKNTSTGNKTGSIKSSNRTSGF